MRTLTDISLVTITLNCQGVDWGHVARVLVTFERKVLILNISVCDPGQGK